MHSKKWSILSQKGTWCDSTSLTSRRICSEHVALHLWRVCVYSARVCIFVWASSCIGNVFTYTVSPCIKSSGRSFSMFPRIHASSCFMSPIRVPQRSKFTGQSSVSQPHGRCDATEPRMQGGGGISRIDSPTVIFERTIENTAVMPIKFRFVNTKTPLTVAISAWKHRPGKRDWNR